MPEYGSCVRPSRTIHCVKSHFEVRSVEQLLNGFEVKEMLHSLNINSDILNNFDNKHRLCWPLHLSEMIHSNFMEIHSFQKVEICDKVFLYFGSLFMYEVGKFLLRRATISRIELDSEILMRSSRIVTCCQQNPPQTVAELIIKFSNVSRAGRSRHDAVESYM